MASAADAQFSIGHHYEKVSDPVLNRTKRIKANAAITSGGQIVGGDRRRPDITESQDVAHGCAPKEPAPARQPNISARLDSQIFPRRQTRPTASYYLEWIPARAGLPN